MPTLNAAYPRPAWQLTLDGLDLAARINPRFMDLRLNEARSDRADQLDLTLTDHDGRLALPRQGAQIELAIGWSNAALVAKGRFIVDEVGHRGAPDIITLRARSADMKGKLRRRDNRSFHNQTLQQIVTIVARANQLQAAVGQPYRSRTIPHIDQANESDMAFLTRLGKRYDAVATVKEGRLLFMPVQGSRTVGGQRLPLQRIYRRDGDSHEFLMASRDTYTGAQATWRDPAEQKSHTVTAGSDENPRKLRDTYTNESDALNAADSEWRRIQRGTATMRFTLAHGLPQLSVQHRIRFPDFKPPISDIEWLVKEITHSIDGQGLTTALELERTGDQEDG